MQSTEALSALIIIAMIAAGRWRMFAKAGEAGWKALVPVYSDYTLFKLVWTAKAFWIYTVAAVCFVGGYVMSGQVVFGPEGELYFAQATNDLFAMVAYVASLLFLIYMAFIAIRTSFAYGKGMVFAVGLLFMPNVFSMILGFGSAEYHRPGM